MAFSELEIKRAEKILAAFVVRRGPPPEYYQEVQLCFRLLDAGVEIYEKRAVFQKPTQMVEIPIAKVQFVKSRGVWKVYWQRADMKWHIYQPQGEVKSLEEFVAVVEADEHYCFFG